MTDYLREVGFRVEFAIPFPGSRALRAIEQHADRVHTCSTPLWRLNEFIKARWPTPFVRMLSPRIETLLRARHLRMRKKMVDGNLGSFILRKINPDLVELTRRVANENPPRAVMAQFAWTARALEDVPAGVIKLLDTHDIQHLRRARAKEAGGDLPGHACTREEEVRELSRADVLIAIQRHEREALHEMCPTKHICLAEHAENTDRFLPSPPASKTVLFVGSLYDPNVRGIKRFLETAWPAVRAAVPGAELTICGTVCDGLFTVPAGVKKMGRVPDLEPYYRQAAVVINPVPYGSGLKIKSVEAISFGKCLVTTPTGAHGLEDDDGVPYEVAPIEEMAIPIIRWLQEPALRDEAERRTHEYARVRFSPRRVYRALEHLIRKGPSSENGRHLRARRTTLTTARHT
jgi:glycosyltransferase involved in cell wall biosynthesis